MNEPETNTPTSVELADEIVTLRHQVFTLLLALIVVSGTLTVFLYRQASITRKDILVIKPQAMQIIQAFKQNEKGMEAFVNQLVAYGQRNPDFAQQVLRKYNIVPPPPPPAPVVPPTAAPATTPAPKPKK